MTLCSAGALAQQPDCTQQHVDKAHERVLYHYFQQDWLQTLTLMEIASQKCPSNWQKVSIDKLNPILLKGGISLVYGLEDQAARLFRQVLSEQPQPKVRANAWFYLGKALYQKGLMSEAQNAFSQLTAEQAEEYLSAADREEWLYLSALVNHRSNQANGPQFQQALSQLDDDSIYAQYLRYNLALQQLQSGQTKSAIENLRVLGSEKTDFFDGFLDDWFAPLRSEQQNERLALQDRANLSLGYALLNEQEPFRATDAFNKVHLDSLDTDAAILGIGWAAAQREEYQLALAAWQQLQRRQDNSEYVLESYLASAYAYEKAFAPTQALATLNQASERYQAQVDLLTESRQQLNDQQFIDWALQPPSAKDIEPHLSELMLTDSFVRQMDDLNQILLMAAQLQDWQQRMQLFYVMLDERQQEAVRRSEALKRDQTLEQLASLQQQREQLAQALANARTQPELLSDEQEVAWQNRLAGAIERHQRILVRQNELKQTPLKESYAQRLARLKGILLWNATEQQAGRLWQTQKALNELDQTLKEAQVQQDRLIAQLQRTPNYAQQRAAIEELQRQLADKLQRVDGLKQQQLAQLHGEFELAIDQQLARLRNYQLQAQLAKVRLNDKAYRKAQADSQQGQRDEP